VITGSVTGSVILIDGNTGSETFNVGTVGIKVVTLGMLVMRGTSCPISHGWRPVRGVGWYRSLHCLM